MKRKLLAILTCICMIMSMIPTYAFADGETAPEGDRLYWFECDVDGDGTVNNVSEDADSMIDGTVKDGVWNGYFKYYDGEKYVAVDAEKIRTDCENDEISIKQIDDVYYLEETNEFVIVSTKGYIRTYFKPDSGKRYYDKQ